MQAKDIMRRLRDLPRSPGTLTPSVIQSAADGELNETTTGQRSLFAEFPAPTTQKLRAGRKNPLKLVIPAYEQFSTNGTGGDDETFNLSHDLTKTPNTRNVVTYFGGSYNGSPKSVDYANDTITVNDPGTDNNLHVWYVADESASIEILKRTPKGGKNGEQSLYNDNLKLVHATDQQEQPEYLTPDRSFKNWVPTDFALEVYIKAPYKVTYTDTAGDGAEATNMLFEIPRFNGADSVKGFGSMVRADMGQGQ